MTALVFTVPTRSCCAPDPAARTPALRELARRRAGTRRDRGRAGPRRRPDRRRRRPGRAGDRARGAAPRARGRRRRAAPAPVDKACGEGLMPTAVGRLRALGVTVEGRPFVGIRYVGVTAVGEAATFRHGPGLGVGGLPCTRPVGAAATEPVCRVEGGSGTCRRRVRRRGGRAAGAVAGGRGRPALGGTSPAGLDGPAEGRPPVLRDPAPLRGAAVDRPRRGALGAAARGLRDAGRRRPGRGGGPGAGRHRRGAGRAPDAHRPARGAAAATERARAGPLRQTRPDRPEAGGSSWSATPPATWTR